MTVLLLATFFATVQPAADNAPRTFSILRYNTPGTAFINVGPESKTMAELKTGMTIINDPAVFTFPSSGPHSTIDFIMVDTPHADRVTVTERRVIVNAEATDHCAVVVKAELTTND